ncbi:MAG: DegT/DnrJ/EryC1/StrS aminotransferase family protein, partial [Desulfobacteraceae bacterium]|nr:DegT/DnrJ/EryC1/StrS aminotransferase family protein [Desulfobacteraceae bacterium]
MNGSIPHNKPTLSEEEIQAVSDVIRTGWIAQGEKVKAFEADVCEYMGIGSQNGVALSSGTAALYLALRVLGIEPGSEVIVPTYTCSAVLNAINLANLEPVPVDINERDFNIAVDSLKRSLSSETAAIIVPHCFGFPAEAVDLPDFDVPIIEDCATALGSKIKSKHVGLFGDICILSFYA